MINVLKMQLLIVKKNQFWLVLVIIASFMFTMFTVMSYYSIDEKMSQALSLETSRDLVEEEAKERTVLEYYNNIIGSDAVVMFVGIFTVFLTLTEFHTKYIKNIWGNIKNKWHYLVAKYILLSLYLLLFFTLSILIVIVCNFLFINAPSFGDIFECIIKCALQFVTQFAFCSSIITISLLVRKIIPVLIGSIIYIAIGAQVIYKIINLFCHNVLNISVGFTITNYVPYGNTFSIVTNSTSADITRVLLTAMIFILGSVVVSMHILKTKEISNV